MTRIATKAMNPRLAIPCLSTNSWLTDHAFRIAVGDVLGNVVPSHAGMAGGEASLMAGLTYGAWTRDAAINTWNGLSAFWPEVMHNTLLNEVDDQKLLVGQYWDAVVWVTGAWQHFLWTGDRAFLQRVYEVSVNWLAKMELEELGDDGVFRGGACFQDGISGYGDRYSRAGGSSCIADWAKANPDQRCQSGVGLPMHCLSTNCLYLNAYEVIGRMEVALGKPVVPHYAALAARLRKAIVKLFRIPQTGLFRYNVDPWGTDDRQEGMGHAFALMFGLVDDPVSFIEAVRSTVHGIPCLWPGYDRYEGTVGGNRRRFGRHAGLVWPQVQAFWADACAGAGRYDVAFAEMRHLAEKALRDGNFFECYHPDDGLPEGGVQEIDITQPAEWHAWCLRERHELFPGGPLFRWVSQPRTTWGATGFMRLILHVCAGLQLFHDRLEIHPHLPPDMDRLSLADIHWRQATLSISIVRGTASRLLLDGRPVAAIASDLQGRHNIEATCAV